MRRKPDDYIWRMYKPGDHQFCGYFVTRTPGDLSEPVMTPGAEETDAQAARLVRHFARNPDSTRHAALIVDLREYRGNWLPWMYSYVYLSNGRIGCYLGPGRSLVCDVPKQPAVRKAA